VDFQDVRTVMYNAGPAVMGTAETRGENRARNAASGALASPLLDNCDIMGAKKILLSIISGAEAELQMDELMEITEYIQQQAGQDAEVIFGHGVDAGLGDRLRVTVIATGFEREEEHEEDEVIETKPTKKEPEQKKVHDLERNQIWLFEQDNAIGAPREVQLKVTEEPKEEKPEKHEDEVVFSGPFNRIDSTFNDDDDTDDGDAGLFADDEDEFDRAT